MYDYVCSCMYNIYNIYKYKYIYMCLWVFPLFFGLMSCETSIILGLVSVWRLKYDHCGSFEFTGWCWSPDIFAVDICHSRIPSRISSRYSPFWLTKPPYWLVMLLILTSFPHENDDVPARKIQRLAKKWHRSTGNGDIFGRTYDTVFKEQSPVLHVLRKLISMGIPGS